MSDRECREVVLGIDTSAILGGVALAAGSRLLAEARVDARAAASERILPQIDRLLSDLGLARDSIGRIGVVIGPGSFTGVRVGLATAKGLAEGLEAGVVPISSVEARAFASGAEGRAVLVLTAPRQGEVFCGAGWREGVRFHWILPPASRPLDDAAWVLEAVAGAVDRAMAPLLCVGDGAGALLGSKAAREAGERLVVLARAAASAVPGAAALLAAEAGASSLLNGRDLDSLVPVYLRGAAARRPKAG